VDSLGLNEETKIYSGSDRTILGPSILLGMADVCSKDETEVERIEVKFLTPTRIIYAGRLTAQVDFPTLIKALRRRLDILSYFHCGERLRGDGSTLTQEASEIETEASDLRWWDWERYSGRQQSRMKLGGVVGKVVYTGRLAPFIPYLKLGEYTHVGSGTSFGLGKIQLH